MSDDNPSKHERRRVEDELARLANEGNWSLADRLTHGLDAVNESIDRLDRRICKIDADLNNRRDGVFFEIDRLKRQSKIMWGAFTAVASAVGVWFWNNITGKG